MTNDNETVEQIADKMIRMADEGYAIDSTDWASGLSRSDSIEFADRFVNAHKRKVAGKDAEIEKLTADNMHKESFLRKAGATVVELMNKVNAQDAALKPIIDFNPDKDGLCPQELRRGLAYCAVREAQRIYKEVKLRMENFEKYKTAADRAVAFQAFCSGNSPCDKCQLKDTTMGSECAFEWLDLDAEEETPMDCPFCGGNVVKESGKLKCSAPLCGYSLMLGRDPDKTVAAHNRVCRAVKEAGE